MKDDVDGVKKEAKDPRIDLGDIGDVNGWPSWGGGLVGVVPGRGDQWK